MADPQDTGNPSAPQRSNRNSREAVSLSLRFEVLRRDKFTCQYCGAKAPDAALHVDHIKSVFEGGTNAPANLLAACVRCNLGKGVRAHQDDDERPYTERERKLHQYYDWFLAHHGVWAWAADVYCGEDPDIRLVLLGLAAKADPYGGVVAEADEICRDLHIDRLKFDVILRGLRAAGLINEYEDGPEWAEMSIGLCWRPLRDGLDEHIPVRVLSTYRSFAPVERIHG